MEQKTQSLSKKVLFLITKSNLGGAQKYVLELATQAKDEGAEVAVAVGGNGPLVEKLRKNGMQIIQISSLGRDINIFKELKSFWKLMTVVKKYKPDVLHLNSSKGGAIGSLVAKLCGVPHVVFTIHGWAFNENRSALAKFFIKIVYFITIALSDISISVSEQTKKQAVQIPFHTLIDRKILVIKNGVKPINLLSRDESRRFFFEKFKIEPDSFVVGTLAELHPIKGLDILLEVTKSFKNLDAQRPVFLIIGEGQEKKSLQNYIDENNIGSFCILGGYIDNASKYLRGFDMFVLPSRSEAMPLSLIEAGQSGLPVVASNVGGISEIIENNSEGLLVEPGNPQALEKAIRTIMNDSELAKKMSSNLENKISRDFSFELFCKNTFDAYKK